MVNVGGVGLDDEVGADVADEINSEQGKELKNIEKKLARKNLPEGKREKLEYRYNKLKKGK